MQFSTTVLLFAASALAATSSPMDKCAKEFTSCQKTAGAVTLLTSCSINLAACSASGAMTMMDEAPKSDAEISEDVKKAYRACQKEYNQCRTEPGANLSTCASEAVECFGEVREEIQEAKEEQGETTPQGIKQGKQGLSINL